MGRVGRLSILLLFVLTCSSPAFGKDGPQEYERECERGDANACGRLGLIYYQGKEVEADLARAVSLSIRACDGGDSQGCFNLAVHLVNGPEETRDPARARKILERSCENAHAQSCGFLGILRRDGLGGPIDQSSAIRNFESACSGGNSMACHNLASAYWEGDGVDANRDRAAALYRGACEGGYGDACTGLARVESGEIAPRSHNIDTKTTIGTTTINGLVFDNVTSSCNMLETMVLLTAILESGGTCAQEDPVPRMIVYFENRKAQAALNNYTPTGGCLVKAVTGAKWGDTVCALIFSMHR